MSDFTRKHKVIFITIVLFFIFLRLPGLHLPYHQDERKYVSSVSVADSNTPHPPITKTILVDTAKIFGRDNFRAMPLLFSVVNLLLLFYVVRFKYGISAALWATFLFSASYYSVLASLMVDIDGAVLPFFFLLSLIGYFKWQNAAEWRGKITWGLLTLVAIALGFLTKLSFIIVIGALILDFLSGKWGLIDKKNRFKYVVMALGLLVFLALVLWFARAVFSSFNLSRTISHAQDYFNLTGRAYLQVLIQVVKALIYSSPILILPLLFISKERLLKLRFFLIFISLGLIFYLIVFDFSRAALDKYLAFLVVPLAVISGLIISEILNQEEWKKVRRGLLVGLVFVAPIFLLQFLPHFVPPLYPKEEWISRIVKLRWNFVFPFTGGSGPVGFYISWLFIALSWIVSGLLAVWAIFRRERRGHFLFALLVIGLVYNLVFAEEYLFGKINGSPGRLLKSAVSFIEKSDSINKVISYNDIGGYELAKIGKYENRIYAVPKYEVVHRKTLSSFKGHYLLVDLPHLNPASLYGRYFASCETIYEDYSRKVSAKIYNCRNAKLP